MSVNTTAGMSKDDADDILARVEVKKLQLRRDIALAGPDKAYWSAINFYRIIGLITVNESDELETGSETVLRVLSCLEDRAIAGSFAGTSEPGIRAAAHLPPADLVIEMPSERFKPRDTPDE